MRCENKISHGIYIVLSKAISILFILPLCSCHFYKDPAHPLISYDEDLNQVNFIQVDTLAHDTAYISIGEIIYDSLSIKDSLFYSVKKALASLNQKVLAYNLIKNQNELLIKVQTKRGIDTSFIYKYKEFDIIPIKTAKVISGPCVGLYDVNYKRDYHKSIRAWMFDNGISPDSLMIEQMNSLMRQLNYSGWNEYSVYKNNIPIVKNLRNQHFKFDVDMSGKYFYLYIGKNIKNIIPFIKEKITENFKDATNSTQAAFKCSNMYVSGPNVIFLISIDENWNYKILPVGFTIIDNKAPEIYTGCYNSRFSFAKVESKYRNALEVSWPKELYLTKSNIKINIPQQEFSICEAVSITYGDFSGDNHWGYNIPFWVAKKGDIKSISIGNKTFPASSIKNDRIIHIHMKSLKIGENIIRISASDIHGNTSTETISISTIRRSPKTTYYDDEEDQYDDLEDRINDLEYRLEELE